MTTATVANPATIESSPAAWRNALFPDTYTAPLADYQDRFWDWLWSIKPDISPDPHVDVWPRGWSKSTTAEDGAVSLGARNICKYALYVSGTQQQADNHVQSIGGRLESNEVAIHYAALSERAVNQYGSSRSWRRSRLWTRHGFIVDALGLDVAIRGVKLGNVRPDLIILDDIDDATDSPETIQKKLHQLTHTILAAANPRFCVVMVVQNIVSRNGIVAQLVDGRADFLANRILNGPYPAIENLVYTGHGKDAVIESGDPTWKFMDLDACQRLVARIGITAFLAECQHDVALTGNPRFNLDRLRYMLNKCEEPLPQDVLPRHLQGIDGLRVYELPQPGVAYVGYTDPAEGKGRDSTASGFMEAITRQVSCVFEENQLEPSKHAEIVCDLWEWYNRGLIGYERAKGEAHALVLGQRGVDRIFQHVDNPLTPQQRVSGIEEKRIPGFPMTEHTKRGLIDAHAELIETLTTRTRDRKMVMQSMDFVVTDNNKLEAAAGGHDDLEILWAGLCLMATQPGAQSVRQTEPRSAARSYVGGIR